MENITDSDRSHVGEYHDLYLQFDTLVSADVFENFRKMCLDLKETK